MACAQSREFLPVPQPQAQGTAARPAGGKLHDDRVPAPPAGVAKSYSPHCLRHTFATQLLNAGVTLEVLKELMGHRSIQNTLKYTQLYEATKRRQYDEAMVRVERRQAVAGGAR